MTVIGQRRLSRFAVAASLLLFLPSSGWSTETTHHQGFVAALNSITSTELGQHVDLLADDSYEGREAGTAGGRAAGDYLAQKLEEYAVEPAGDAGTFFQRFGHGYRNVLGFIPGRDPQLKHEFLVVSAHYDHVGYGTRRNSFGPIGEIHNGADDNASGTSGVLEVAQAFSMLPEPPRRSVLFIFWDGEEKGLLGSKHWIEHPTVSLDQIVMVFNSDMIGRLRNHRVEVYGVRTAPGLRRLLSHQNVNYGLDLDFMWDVLPNSDHHSFFERDIPFLMLHTGLHDNYHRPSDDAELINRQGIQAIAQLMFSTVCELAESPEKVRFRSESRVESNVTRAQFERSLPSPPPRLGVSWSPEDTEAGLQITHVTANSAADLAGLRTGDRLLQFDGHVVKDGAQLQMIVLAAANAAVAVVQRPGEDAPVELPVALPGKPMRVGISWDQDRADPTVIILTQVVAGSAASQAGLAVGDRVYEVNDQAFADGTHFGQLVTTTSGPLRLLVERRGMVRHLTVQPLLPIVSPDDATPADSVVSADSNAE